MSHCLQEGGHQTSDSTSPLPMPTCWLARAPGVNLATEGQFIKGGWPAEDANRLKWDCVALYPLLQTNVPAWGRRLRGPSPVQHCPG